MKKRKSKIIWLIFGLLILLMIGNTFAYFQKSESIDNKFQSAEAKVYINEKFDPDDEWLPGEEKQKEVRFGNEGNIASVLRIKFTPVLKRSNGTEDAEAAKDFQLNFADNLTDNWTEKDGWYYYNKVLSPGDLTDVTLKSVTMSDAIGNDEHGIALDYSEASYQITIESELLQASFAADAAQFMQWGCTPTVTGDTVTWN